MELYKDCIVGRAVSKKILGGAAEAEGLQLRYEDILYVTTKTNKVVLTYSGGVHEVQAKKVEFRVMQIINERKKALEQTA